LVALLVVALGLLALAVNVGNFPSKRICGVRQYTFVHHERSDAGPLCFDGFHFLNVLPARKRAVVIALPCLTPRRRTLPYQTAPDQARPSQTQPVLATKNFT
jgi:hypothetical protein